MPKSFFKVVYKVKTLFGWSEIKREQVGINIRSRGTYEPYDNYYNYVENTIQQALSWKEDCEVSEIKVLSFD